MNDAVQLTGTGIRVVMARQGESIVRTRVAWNTRAMRYCYPGCSLR